MRVPVQVRVCVRVRAVARVLRGGSVRGRVRGVRRVLVEELGGIPPAVGRRRGGVVVVVVVVGRRVLLPPVTVMLVVLVVPAVPVRLRRVVQVGRMGDVGDQGRVGRGRLRRRRGRRRRSVALRGGRGGRLPPPTAEERPQEGGGVGDGRVASGGALVSGDPPADVGAANGGPLLEERGNEDRPVSATR